MLSFRPLVSGETRGPLSALARAGLWLARGPYALGVNWRNRRFDRDPNRATRIPVPVISVGNLTLGGTGKTVAVEAVAKVYREADWSVAILSRGYGAKSGPNPRNRNRKTTRGTAGKLWRPVNHWGDQPRKPELRGTPPSVALR